MKLGVYFKEAWRNLLSDKLYSLIYIAAIACSLAMLMTYLTVVSMRVSNSYPEEHRDRMLSIPMIGLQTGRTSMERNVSEDFINRFLSEPLPGVETWTAFKVGDFKVYNAAGESARMIVQFIDGKFTGIFPLNVVYGRSIDSDGAVRNVPDVMISESAAVLLLGRRNVVGESIFFNDREFRICGVVRDVPMTATYSFAQIWAPDVMTTPEERGLLAWLTSEGNLMGGSYELVMLADSRRDFENIRSEFQNRIDKYNGSGISKWKMSLPYGIPSVVERIFMYDSASAYTWVGLGVVLLVLLVPVFNLAGMTGSGMESRMAEFGVRKSYGACPRAIVRQIVGENLLQALIGGAVGLLLSYLLLYLLQNQLYDLLPLNSLTEYMDFSGEHAFTFRSFFHVELYLLLLAFVLVIDLLSAIAPVSMVLRRPIVESLNAKR